MLDKLTRICDRFYLPSAHAILSTDDIETVFTGAIGSYGKIKGAPAYIAFIGDSSDPSFQEKVGYVGEGIILEAISLGLGTCWVGGTFQPEAVAQNIPLRRDERVLAVTPVGYPQKGFSLGNSILKGIAKSGSRKPLAELTDGLPQEEWPEWITAALETARLAPSAANRQPWRFLVEKRSITVSVDDLNDTHNISKRLDCGIAMLHLELGARRHKDYMGWEYLDAPNVARLTIE